jgi:RNA ligase (TIGR02306 family)
MADLKVEVVKINVIKEHPNADRMELAYVDGYQVCVQIGTYKVGDTAVYIPVDSVLPDKLEAFIFGENAKVKLNKHRVRLIKLRKAPSHGMLMTIDEVLEYFLANKIVAGCLLSNNDGGLGYDLTDLLGITKYMPPVKVPNAMSGKAAPKRHCHPMFSKYTEISHLKKYWNAFMTGEEVYITEKVHGTNFRCGWVPFVARTFWQKLKNIFGLNKPYEFVYGSHNVQLMDGKGKDAFSDNVYKRVVKEHDLKNKIIKGQLWYGEIFGHGIQTGYEYGFKDGKVDVVFMDIKDVAANIYLDFDRVIELVQGAKEQVVPYTWGGYNPKLMLEALNSPGYVSKVDLKTTPVEGFVVRPYVERSFYGGRLILKILSDEYLLRKDNSDWK